MPDLDAALDALRTGTVSMRLARTESDIDAAQALRYRVFYEEMQAKASQEAASLWRVVFPFDVVCDLLLVTDLSMGA